MLRRGLHAAALHPDDGLLHGDAREIRIRPKALPVPTTRSLGPERPSNRPEEVMDAGALGLVAHVLAALADQVDVPCCGRLDPRRESGGAGAETDACVFW